MTLQTRKIEILNRNSSRNYEKIRFVDLFAGIGGFHLALHKLGGECVFASELDEGARKTYRLNFGKINHKLFMYDRFNDDVWNVNLRKVPDFDLLCAGFPCQPFSQAGYKKGFRDNKNGNLFFSILNFLKVKKPAAFFLENVSFLLNHNKGKTFQKIKNSILEINYSFNYNIVRASDFNLPQGRPRLFMIGFNQDKVDCSQEFKFPKPVKLKKMMKHIWKSKKCDKKIGYSIRVGGKSSPMGDKRNWDGYLVDGKIKRLTPIEGKQMMGFPKKFIFPVSKNIAMKLLGNSIAINAVKACCKKIKLYLKDNTY